MFFPSLSTKCAPRASALRNFQLHVRHYTQLTHSINQLRSKTLENIAKSISPIQLACSNSANKTVNNKKIVHYISSLDNMNNMPVIDIVLRSDSFPSPRLLEDCIKDIEKNPRYAQYKTIGCVSSSILYNKAKELSFDQVKALALNPKKTGLDEFLIRKWLFIQTGYVDYPDDLLYSLFRN